MHYLCFAKEKWISNKKKQQQKTIQIKSLKTKLFISSIFSLLDTDTMNDEYSQIWLLHLFFLCVLPCGLTCVRLCRFSDVQVIVIF